MQQTMNGATSSPMSPKHYKSEEIRMFYWSGGLGTVIIVLLILWLLGII